MADLPSFETLLLDRADGVLTITLNRPDVLNAFNDQMGYELHDALRFAERDAEARCLVLTGAGRGFCSGQDLRDRMDAAAPLGESLRRRYHPVIVRLATIEKPVVAAVNGVAAGAGFSLALACDVRLAAEGAAFIQVFSRVGLAPDSGSTYFLPRLIGLGRALEVAWTADRIDAQTALAWGIVNRIVPAERLAETTREFAGRLAAGPTRAFGLTKRAMRRNLHATLDEALDYEAYVQEIAGRSDDFREGVAAFLEKRQPQFRGR